MGDYALPGGLLDGASTVALVVLFYWMLATGRVVTRREADGIRRDRDDWKAAHATSEVARHESLRQSSELIEHARVTETFVRGLSQVDAREKP